MFLQKYCKYLDSYEKDMPFKFWFAVFIYFTKSVLIYWQLQSTQGPLTPFSWTTFTSSNGSIRPAGESFSKSVFMA